MPKYLLYGHNGSENHGCEAIVRTFAKINFGNEIILLPYNMGTDQKYGVSEVIPHIEGYYQYGRLSLWRFYVNLIERLFRDKDLRYRVFLKNVRSQLNKGDIAISVGGDNYCYSGFPPTLAAYNRIFKSYGMKTVLFGASIEPSVLEDENVIEDMRLYDLVMVRETLTLEALKRKGIYENVVLIPDSAFILDSLEEAVPENFLEGNTVGLNLSPRVGLTGENHEKCFDAYCKLIEHIITHTKMNIALIPHVVASNSDDRDVLRRFYEKYKATGRICMIEDSCCEVLKGVVKRCRFVVAARTHCSIAAYSQEIPTMVIGYSIKSKGIAKDLFGDYEHYVVPVEQIDTDEKLVSEFNWLMEHEEEIKRNLHDIMPNYKKNVYKSNSLLNQL